MSKQVTTILPDDLSARFDQLCESRGQTPYGCLKDLVEFIVGENDAFGKPEEPVGMSAEEALRRKPKLDMRPARERLMEQWRLEGRFRPGERP